LRPYSLFIFVSVTLDRLGSQAFDFLVYCLVLVRFDLICLSQLPSALGERVCECVCDVPKRKR
jgi:hypothetical protein